MCYGGDDESDVWVFSWIKARKERQCCACHETIRKGQIYHRYKSLADGDWSQWDHCSRCWAICQKLWELTGGECIDLELDCGETWKGNFGAEPDDVAALAFELPAEAQARAEVEYADKGRRRDVMP